MRSEEKNENNKNKIERIIRAVGIVEKVDPNEILGRSRIARVVRARKLVSYFTRAIHPGFSFPFIASVLNKNHTAILHHIEDLNNLMDTYKEEEEEVMNKLDLVRLLSGNHLLFDKKELHEMRSTG